MDELEKLQNWYQSQCNADWEHSFGVKVDTLDNPGWIVTIDLSETDLESKRFDPISRGDSEEGSDWVICKVDEGQFIACGGVRNLKELLGIFIQWAGA